MLRLLSYSIFLFAATSVFSQSVELTAEEQRWIEDNPVVYYGYDPAWEPIEYMENDRHVGISKDYVDLLSKRIGFELKAHPEATTWEKSYELFKSGDVKVLTSIGSNKERDKIMYYTTTYLEHAWVIVTAREGDFVGSIHDLQDKKVATPKGYAITTKLENENLNMKFVYTENVEESLMKIETGEAEATVGNIAIVSHYLNYRGYENLKIAAPADYPDVENKMGVTKKDSILLGILNKGLASITIKEKNEITQNWVSVKFDYGVNMAKVWTIAGISAFVVGLVFAFVMYWNRKLKKEVTRRKEAEEQLQISFEEISAQKMLIEEKNEEVMDSIKYAKRIQQAILPSLERINGSIPQNFILYQPKDIVAGDFYWVENVAISETENIVFVAAADCTGHGVPGAMVSVICSYALNKAVLEFGLTDPGEILDKTTDLVIERFSKAEEEVKDGMDIGLSSIRFLNGDKAKIEFAGAHNHLWVVTNRESLGIESVILQQEDGPLYLHEIKASKQPVGVFDNRIPFKTKSVFLEKGERFFLYSDGYADQFGGELGKKFKNKSFKKLLLQTMDNEIVEQGNVLKDKFMEWKGEFEQLDDVCVIGVQI